MKTNRTLSAFIVALLIVSSAMAQEERRAGPQIPCPHPIVLNIKAPPPSPPTLDPADFAGAVGAAAAGSVWNQTQPNKSFGHSFHFPHPGRECCLMTKGTLIVWVKALQTGKPGSASSANDWVELIHNGQSIPGTGQQPFAGGATAGQTGMVTINVPASILATGTVSLYVQDDTAVTMAELRLEGCCLK